MEEPGRIIKMIELRDNDLGEIESPTQKLLKFIEIKDEKPYIGGNDLIELLRESKINRHWDNRHEKPLKDFLLTKGLDKKQVKAAMEYIKRYRLWRKV